MIFVPVDEAAAFDMFSIFSIKQFYGLAEAESSLALKTALEQAVGTALCAEVLASVEYNDLFYANWDMWHIQEKAMRDACPASYVDRFNQTRYHAKQRLQQRFFKQGLQELKSKRPYEQPV